MPPVQTSQGVGSHAHVGNHALSDYPASGWVEYSSELGGYLRGWGTTVPTDGDTGYAPGCIFQKTSATAGVYINIGNAASCNFDSVV